MQAFRYMAVLCALVAALCVVGCGGNASGAASSGVSSQPASASSTSSSAADAASAGSSASASGSSASATAAIDLADGAYTATFKTDSTMFHVNEADDGKGTLTVKDGEATIHVHLASKKIVNLYAGPAADARQDGAELIEPTVDKVTYSDGYTEDVYGFDVPVPALDEQFDVAILGEKGTWYDHKVSVSDPQAQ